MDPKILVAEDEEIMRITVVDHLRSHGWQIDAADSGTRALELIKQNDYQLLLSDIRMPGLDGEVLLAEVKKVSPHTEVVMMTAHGNTDTAINCLKNGAADYIQKPFDLDDLSFRIKRILEMQLIKARCVSLEHCGGQRRPIIGSSAPMQKVLSLISQVSGSDSSILIQGESGTGKELVAAAIHFESRRADKPYVRVNCAAIPEGLMESEFFGHEKGAFTGAEKTSVGKFELADQGTILLDEIGDMPLDLQVKLLRVLQEREIERVGGKHPIPVNVRVLCSTAKNLAGEVEKGNFRQDLFYRLQVIPIEIPALRDRKDDIGELADFFLGEFGRERGLSFDLSAEARQALESYPFPGNVRELHNILERVSVLAPTSKIQLWDLPTEIWNDSAAEKKEKIPDNLAEAVAEAEKKCILHVLKKTDDNKTEAAAILGISRKNLWEKMKGYGL
ncbi:MAG TPA: sigma-54 dependent transcriptional regulator [Geopsychrobacteraceae bacterium]|nr:sigma-54 dependent transcriptional regulator [Geopsychrobacteraceae bacterium]